MKKILMALAILTTVVSLAYGETVVSGTFNGQTASPLTIGVGFVPDWVKVYNVEGSTIPRLAWSINMRSHEMQGGLSVTGASTAVMGTLLYTNLTGIYIYRGGDVVTATTCTNYLIRDASDKRDSGTGAAVTYWTLDTNATRAGHFDAMPSATYVGEGSRVNIAANWYTILSAGGDMTVKGSVQLSEAAASGDVMALRSMYDYKVASDGDVIPAGFTIKATDLNIAADLCFFEAGVYDER